MRSEAVKITAVLLSLLILSFGLIAGNAHAQEGAYNRYPDWFDEKEYDGSHYFLRTFNETSPPYLYPSPPNINQTNAEKRVKLVDQSKVFFPFARADWSSLEDIYWDDPEYAPRLSIVINSGKMDGKELNFEIWFDFDGLAEKESDVDAKAIFDTYTTWMRDDTEIVNLTAKEIVGEMRNFDNSTDRNVGNIKLVVWRTDDQDDTLFIYCGAYKSYSWIIVPFKFHRDFEVEEEDGDDNTVRFAAVLIVVGLLGLACVIYYIYWSRKQKTVKDDDAKEEPESKREHRRKHKEKQKQKGKRFYRKNR